MKIREFVDGQYLHFNAAALGDAARAYITAVDAGAPMLVTLAGAMSTGELGKSLAEMIRRDKVHAISCTGANLEEDIFNLVAHDHYERVPNYRELSASDEEALLARGLPRVTDTCIPEEEAIRKIEKEMLELWVAAERAGTPKLPHEFFYELIRSGALDGKAQIDPADSWLVAACEKNLPIITPGWEDSTMGNIFASHVLGGDLKSETVVRSGIAYMLELARWYREKKTGPQPPGFFQIGGGIAGDFPICVVPMLRYDLEEETPNWSYFCQISDSTTSYGSYSGAVPNEKITWGKLGSETPRFVIESDATIVAPLIFAYVLDW